jgi:hypothetical protein
MVNDGLTPNTLKKYYFVLLDTLPRKQGGGFRPLPIVLQDDCLLHLKVL